VQGAGWQAASAQLAINLAGGAGQLRVEGLELPPPVGRIRTLKVQCDRFEMGNEAIACAQARFHVLSPWLSAADFRGAFRFVQHGGVLHFTLHDVPFGGGKLALEGRYAGSGWELAVQGDGLQLAALLKAAGMGMSLPRDLSLAGAAGFRLTASGGGGRPLVAGGRLGVESATLGANDGALATEKLSLTLSGDARRAGAGWQFSGRLSAPGGQAYVEPVFLDFAQAPLKASFRGHWEPAAHRIALDAFDVEQDATLAGSGAMVMDYAGKPRLDALQFSLRHAQFPGAYTRYLQPFLIGTVMDSLETAGGVGGMLDWADGAPRRLALKLDALQLDDSKRRFALYDVRGDVNWSADAAAPETTRLQWAGGSAYKVNFGPSQIGLRTGAGNLSLLEPARIPVLDGALQVRRFELHGLGRPDMDVVFDGLLEPIGMEGLCSALGWPLFGGKLAGTLPTLEYRDNRLTVGGTLRADVFDGRVEVDQLRLEQPLSTLPRLSASVKLRQLDLESMTRAFSFGRITGRLDGDIRGLELLKWQPVAFDGRLYTSPGDRSRHRISQRAIENISNLGGGGAAGALSRGFLQFFKDFAYDRLALGCRLENGTCYMSGLEPAQDRQAGGYYIVKGSLVPRIDVIGFASRVSWDSLLQQLKSVTESEGPVVR
jgi:hypothetical protein